MRNLDLSADDLVSSLLTLSQSEQVCLLDSCDAENPGSHLLIAGLAPVNTLTVNSGDPNRVLAVLDGMSDNRLASILTISYDFGLKLQDLAPLEAHASADPEPDLYVAQFDCLIVHDYRTATTGLVGNSRSLASVERKLRKNISNLEFDIGNAPSEPGTCLSKEQYLRSVCDIQEMIRRGDTYQTNLTQQFTVRMPHDLSPHTVFARLRRDHPAPFSAFITREGSTVVSVSPERFVSIDFDSGTIYTSPIKGTRGRGRSLEEDTTLRKELAASAKDRAENIMIVDLLRNDLGQICSIGSVVVDSLCELQTHPTFHNLVSTVRGRLRPGVGMSEILTATFPCGSITGAPKLNTMRIIDRIEPVSRGLSMGAIGYYIPPGAFEMPERLDLSVAIRTAVIRDGFAVFNVGGGIVIDSDPESEYREIQTKSRALLGALGL